MTDDAGAQEPGAAARPAHDAILLAGGRASRLGGIDKTALVADGTTLLDRAVAAAAEAERVVIVGLREGRAVPASAVVTREDPPLGGPVAALAAGLAAVATSSAFTLVLACDLVRPEEAAARLLAAPATVAPHDGLIAVDDEGHRQPLLALYRTAALQNAVRSARAADGGLGGQSMRRLLAPLDLVEVALPSALCADVDSPGDAARLA